MALAGTERRVSEQTGVWLGVVLGAVLGNFAALVIAVLWIGRDNRRKGIQ